MPDMGIYVEEKYAPKLDPEAVARLGDVGPFGDLEDDCPRCEGVGVVSDPAWMAWHERESAARKAWQDANPGGDWWSTSESKAFEAETPESDAEEYGCPKCRGCGQIPTAEGERLLRFIRNHRQEGQ